MLNLVLKLETFHTLLSSKRWYHLLTIELYRSNLFHEFTQCIAESHIFLIQKEKFKLHHMRNVIAGTHLCTRLKHS